MDRINVLLENSKRDVRYWWLLAVVGVALLAAGILIFNVSLSEITLPIVLGFWLLMRAFATIGLGGDMNALEIPGAGWTVFTDILLLLCAVWILLQPLVFGRTAVLVWVSISLLFAGTGACSQAFQLRCSHPNDGGREH